MTATLTREPEAASPPPAVTVPRSHRRGPRRAWPSDHGWIATLGVTLLAGLLRFNRLDRPGSDVFDEVYYHKDAQDLLRHGVESNAERTGPGLVVHPPLGKWMIAVGQQIFGETPFGWRFAAAVCGTLSVLVLIRIGRRMTGSTLLGCLAGLLMATDGLHFVQSRMAMLDIFLLFWVVLALGCLVLDRDQGRRRAASRVAAASSYDAELHASTERSDGAVLTHTATRRAAVGGWAGPGLGIRWWRVALGVCLGFACAVKWSGVWYAATFPLLALAWDAGLRRSLGVRRYRLATLRRDVPQAVLTLGLLPVASYVATWTGWFLSSPKWGYKRDEGPIGLLHYHQEVLRFHDALGDYHPSESTPWSWLVMARPTPYYANYPQRGDQGCDYSECVRFITDVGNPFLWWGGLAALVVLLLLWMSTRDWRMAAVLVGWAASWVPWALTPGRTMFFFYMTPAVPFLALGVMLVAGLVLGKRDASANRRAVGAVLVGGFTALAVLNFTLFYPIWTAQPISKPAFDQRMWMVNWR